MPKNIFLLALSFFVSLSTFANFRVDVSEAPSDDLGLTVSAIKSAKKSIYLNIYEFTSPEIASALVDQIRSGIHVEILEEGQPVGGLSAPAKNVERQIVSAMAGTDSQFLSMTSKASKNKRRFRFDHAKYAVIDESNLLIGSENYSPTGNPVPGKLGNRGWEVFIHDSGIANEYLATFKNDSDIRFGDLIDIRQNGVTALLSWQSDFCRESADFSPSANSLGLQGNAPTLDATEVKKITSPDSSLTGLLEIINTANETIDIEQMTFDSAWSNDTNPLVTALVNAANRGIRVRVLLNDEEAFNRGGTAKPKNTLTIDALNRVQNITAKTANLKAMGVDYIHNKGMVADGNRTLISSINWDQNSITNNREAAVVISSPEVYSHYEALFEHDWTVSQ